MPDSTRPQDHTRRHGAVLSRADTRDHDTRRLRTQPDLPPASPTARLAGEAAA
jgi:hypothetical protein